MDVTEPVIVAEPGMGKPPTVGVASLVAKGATHRRHVAVVRNDHPALAGRDLLVGIKAENPGVPERAGWAVLVSAAQRLT